MSLKKFLKSNSKAQSIIEYALLTAIAISGILGLHFVTRVRNNAFNDHFNIAAYYIGGIDTN